MLNALVISALVAAVIASPAPGDTETPHGIKLHSRVNERPSFTIPDVYPTYPKVPEIEFLPTSARLKDSPDAGSAYIDDIVFLGDSTTYMLKAGELLPGGFGTHQVWTPRSGTLTLAYVNLDNTKILYPETGEELTVCECVRNKKPKILVITLGVNGISFMNEQYFKAVYTELVNNVKRESPETVIILQSIFPLAPSYDVSTGITNERINLANTWIETIALNTGVYYLHTTEILKNKSGYLPERLSSGDGLHMMPEAYQKILLYIRTHAVPELLNE